MCKNLLVANKYGWKCVALKRPLASSFVACPYMPLRVHHKKEGTGLGPSANAVLPFSSETAITTGGPTVLKGSSTSDFVFSCHPRFGLASHENELRLQVV